MAALFDRRFLITGATGFVGACLARRLVREGAEVHLLVRQDSDRWRIQDILPRVKEHLADLRDRERLREVVRGVRPHVILHCAAYGGYHFQQDATTIIETNFLGTINLVDALSGVAYDCFVNTGSSSEYGHKTQPMSEGDILEPLAAYGVAKAASTLFCQAKARAEGLPIVTLRLFSPYGCYEEPTRLVPYAIQCCLSGKDPELSSGEFVRDFVYVGDVVDAYLVAAAAPPSPGEIVNIGSGEQHSVRTVVERIIALSSASVRPRWGKQAPRVFDTTFWVADISKAKALWGWAPSTSLDEGLARTIAWQRKQARSNVPTRAVPAGAEKPQGATSNAARGHVKK